MIKTQFILLTLSKIKERIETMISFLQRRSKWMKYISLIGILIVPFLLYTAAITASSLATNLLLVLMGLCMGLALLFG